MKKLITAIVAGAMAIFAHGGSWTDRAGVTWYFVSEPSEIDSQEMVAKITGAEGYGDALNIPATVYDAGVACTVAAISNNAFDSRSYPDVEKIKTVVIPDGVSYIGVAAFFGCSNLKSVTLPSSLSCIEGNTFNCCTSLESIVIPDDVMSIGYQAFKSSSRLASITLPDGLMDIKEGAFCFSGLESVTIPPNVTNIGKYAFYDCDFSSIAIPSSVTSIGEHAFDYVSRLRNVVFMGDAPTIGESAFFHTDSECTAYVKRSSTGWGVEIPGELEDIDIAYLPDTCAISFHANGGTGGKSFSSVGGGRALGYYMNKVSPKRTGYTFNGWWTEKSGGNKVIATDLAVGDATYYAHWKIPSYTVQFHANGGTGGKTFSIPKGMSLGDWMAKVNPSRTGCTFDGWWTARSGGTQVTESTIANSDATYYAHWIVPTCSIFFHANGGTGGKTFASVAVGAKLIDYMAKVSPKRDGYTFNGWWTAKTGGTQVTSSDVATGDATYYAHWKAPSCSIFFHANGGTGGKTFSVTKGAKLGTYMDKVSPKRDGYTFDGWWTAKTGGTQVASTDTANADATYYAHWK